MKGLRNILALCATAVVLFSPDVVAATRGDGEINLAQIAPADQNTIAAIQQLLTDKGFDPGPADGRIGPKTRQAITDWQRAAGLPDNGEPSAALLEALRHELGAEPGGNAADPVPADGGDTGIAPEASVPAGTPEAGEILGTPTNSELPPDTAETPALPDPGLVGTAWRFVDDTGGEFTLAFAPNGKLEDVVYADFWNWRQTGDEVVISYDNGLGRAVTREGVLTDPDSMRGQASTSRGKSWNWSATRISGGN